jgi:class 3 adenylate cyclase
LTTPEAARIAELEAEVERLRLQLSAQTDALFTMGGFKVSEMPPTNFTIAGLEERVLVVDSENNIRYANTGMAELLGAEDKHDLLRAPLSRWDASGKLHRGMLTALVDATRAAARTLVSEHEFSHWLAPTSSIGVHTIPQSMVLRFVSYRTEGSVQIVVQDISRLRLIERSFARYVAPEVIGQLLSLHPDELMRVQRRTVTVLFSDLRGFTALCESLAPAAVCTLLNRHFEDAVDAVILHRGTVDKLMGDSLMAVFGAPQDLPDFAVRALAAARAMQQSHKEWMRVQGDNTAPPGLGIGLATGEVVVGNVGTPQLMDYTAIGLTVSLASRLCHAAHAGQVLIDVSTYNEAKRQLRSGTALDLPRLSFQPAGSMRFKNVNAPVEVISVTDGLTASTP